MLVTIKNAVELFRAGFHHTKLKEYEREINAIEETCKFDGIKYIEVTHTGFVLGSFARMACLYIRQDGSVKIPVIVKEKMMEKMSDNLNKFAVLHELGHFQNHMDLVDEFGKVTIGYDIRLEYEADLFAVEYMGFDNVIAALKELQRCSICSNYDIRIQITRRLQLMENKMSVM